MSSNIPNQFNKFFLIIFIFIIFVVLEFQFKINRGNKKIVNTIENKKLLYNSRKCYIPSNDKYTNIIHIVYTRFIMELIGYTSFYSLIYKKNYILNGIRVMKKYLIPSLENLQCKDFIWVVTIGDKANITLVKSLINFNLSFEYKIIYFKYFKKFVRNMTKNFDILITTRIDYDDLIYYDAVNDVRKAININRPMILYGYHHGVYLYEKENKFYEFYYNYKNKGAMSIFYSLIVILNKVNDSYTIEDLGSHLLCRKNFLKNYRSFGIKNLNYEPAIFDQGDTKFIYVRQKFSGIFNFTLKIKRRLKTYNINISNFLGKSSFN